MGQLRPYKTQEELCAIIREVWWLRGHQVDVKVVDLKINHSHGTVSYRVVGSNLVNGLPSDGPVNIPKPPLYWRPLEKERELAKATA